MREATPPSLRPSGISISGLARAPAACLAVLVLLLYAVPALAAGRLDEIRERDTLTCGIWPHVAGFASERDGQYEGFEIDICRAIAAAVLGDSGKTRFVPVEHVIDFIAHDDIDLVVRRLTYSASRERETGTVFGPVVFHDGQGFLVARDSGLESASQLVGTRVCVINMEHHPRTLLDYFGKAIRLVMVESDAQAEEALRSGRCVAYSADISWLAAARSAFVDGVARYELLPDRISDEPLAPLMRAGDDELADVVSRTISAMIADGAVFERNLGSLSAIQLDRSFSR
jgi:general L-amino acid transport system substrate-binding protein